ncbi:hypothetical protein [Ralstonia solanacearum]|uniref:hypothetical protein n=1 Tax=Ralstonia solanacearum TaxID=305 RepID=UPI0019D3431D|nr:hypothetical protein [Ralstonia solanacearum]
MARYQDQDAAAEAQRNDILVNVERNAPASWLDPRDGQQNRALVGQHGNPLQLPLSAAKGAERNRCGAPTQVVPAELENQKPPYPEEQNRTTLQNTTGDLEPWISAAGPRTVGESPPLEEPPGASPLGQEGFHGVAEVVAGEHDLPLVQKAIRTAVETKNTEGTVELNITNAAPLKTTWAS